MIQVLVQDSYHTEGIADTIQKYFGDKVVCHKDHCPEGVKIDIFILSGKNILSRGPELVAGLKSRIGTQNSKVVATSVMSNFLDQIKRRPELGVDFVISKFRLATGLPQGEKEEEESILDQVLAAVS
jgi:hypothetical protein